MTAKKIHRRPLMGKPITVKPPEMQGRALQDALEGIDPLDGDIDEPEWMRVSGLLVGLRRLTSKERWSALWARVKASKKAGVRDPDPLIRALLKFEILKKRMKRGWARDTGYNAEREQIRKAKDPEAYKRANTARQQKRRAKLKAEKAAKAAAVQLSQVQATPANDQHLDAQAAE